MILLYALAVALLLGTLLRGSLSRLGNVHVEWGPLIIAAFAAQLVLFSEPVASRIGDLGPAAYVASTGIVLVVVFRNIRLTGVPLIAAGGVANMLAILTNGGYMPASPDALLAAGRAIPEGYTNSSAATAPAFGALTDIFAMPKWLPAANVFSVGDLLIGLGLIVAIVVLMRGGAGASAKLPLKDTAAGTP